MEIKYNERHLISAIILRALKDHGKKRFKNETEEFFTTKRGKELCESVDLSADFILNRLKSGKIKLKEDEE